MFFEGGGNGLRGQLGWGKIYLATDFLRYREANGLGYRFEEIGFIMEAIVGYGLGIGCEVTYGCAYLWETLGANIGDKSMFLEGTATNGDVGGFVTFTNFIEFGLGLGIAMLA